MGPGRWRANPPAGNARYAPGYTERPRAGSAAASPCRGRSVVHGCTKPRAVAPRARALALPTTPGCRSTRWRNSRWNIAKECVSLSHVAEGGSTWSGARVVPRVVQGFWKADIKPGSGLANLLGETACRWPTSTPCLPAHTARVRCISWIHGQAYRARSRRRRTCATPRPDSRGDAPPGMSSTRDAMADRNMAIGRPSRRRPPASATPSRSPPAALPPVGQGRGAP